MSLDSIEGDMKCLNTNSICKENLSDVMKELSANLKWDIDQHGLKIKQNEDQLSLLTEGLNSTNQDLRKVKKNQSAWEEDILKYKVKMEQDKASMTRKLAEMEEMLKEIKSAKETKGHDVTMDNKSKNIILEGLNEVQEEDVYNTVIRTIKELNLNIFDNDINIAYRIGTYKSEYSWPRPIRVEFISTHVRDVIWENRRRLENSPTHYNVRISRDESKDVRIARALLRKGAQRARNQGKTVYQHPDHILINGQKYDLTNAKELEEQTTYVVKVVGKNQHHDQKDPPFKVGAKKQPAERKTKRGLAFFTGESKRSCFYPVKVVYEDIEYKTPEHNYQCIKALTSELMDLYHKIKEADTPKEAKRLGANIPYNREWERIKPEVMYKIQLRKHEQHPELGNELCEIDGLFMEASRDRYWATGVTIMDEALDTGEFGGRNELGTALNRVKDTLLARRSLPMTDPTSPQKGHLAPHTEEVRPVQSSPMCISTPAIANFRKPAHSTDTRPVPQTTSAHEAHSTEIEVLETNVVTPEKRVHHPWEPQIVIKEGVIVV